MTLHPMPTTAEQIAIPKMQVNNDFRSAFAQSPLSIDADGIAHVKVTGVMAHLDEFQRWVLRRCEDVHARGCVIDFRRAIVAIDWVDYLADPHVAMPAARLLPMALVANPALLDDLRDWAWCRAKQGHMRGIFPDAASATTWAADRGWVGLV